MEHSWAWQYIGPWNYWCSDFWKEVNQIQYLKIDSLFSLQLFVRHVSGAYHFGLRAFAFPEFYGRKVLLLFLIATSCLLHRKIPGQWEFWSILHPLALHVLVCLFHFLYSECCLVAHVLEAFSTRAGYTYSYYLVTRESNSSLKARLNIFCCRD